MVVLPCLYVVEKIELKDFGWVFCWASSNIDFKIALDSTRVEIMAEIFPV